MTTRSWIGGVIWLLAYVALIAAVIVSLVDARNHTLSQMDTPQVQAEWETWRQAVRDQPESAPVKRRVPKSSEPPLVVLLRDYFGVCLAAAVVFSSLLFGVISFMVRGVLRSEEKRSEEKP